VEGYSLLKNQPHKQHIWFLPTLEEKLNEKRTNEKDITYYIILADKYGWF
jgi:hypothetical protein